MIVDDERKDATFGSLLRIHRERAIFRRRTLLSQNQFASEISKKTGLYHTRNLVSNWENDKSSLHPKKIGKFYKLSSPSYKKMVGLPL